MVDTSRIKSESQLQAWFVKALRASGNLVYKFSSPAKRGVPDLIVIAPNGFTIFCEMKAPHGRGVLSKLQKIEIDTLRGHGATVHVVDSVAQCEGLIRVLSYEK